MDWTIGMRGGRCECGIEEGYFEEHIFDRMGQFSMFGRASSWSCLVDYGQKMKVIGLKIVYCK